MRGFSRTVGILALALLIGGSGAGPAQAGTATIIRDEYGVPHVYGNNLKATWYGVGYAMAQDRLWQADILRRTALGTQAEIFGASAVPGDVTARLVFGPKSRRDAQFKNASKRLKKVFRWYAKGVNAYIADATAAGTLPVEYEGLGLAPPRNWTPDDSIAVGMALLNNFGESGANEFDHLTDLQEFVARFGAAEGGNIFIDTHLPHDPAAPTSVPATAAAASAHLPALTAQQIVDAAPNINARQAARKYKAAFKGWRRNMERAGLGQGPASNAIAIGKGLSASGRPILLHGPQMGYTTPQINHEMGIHGGGYDVTGMSIAGIPAIAIGVNRRLAWTLTTGGTDNNDIYLESVSGDQYAFGGALRDFDCRVETINVRGGSAVQQPVCLTVHGPVVEQVPGIAFSLKSATRGLELEALEGLHEMMTARNIRQFSQGLSRPAYNFNVLYGDVKGNIAYWHAGRIPVRAAGDSPWFPHIGAGIAEWQGFMPWSEQPHARNPEQGWLTSWNNKPRQGWTNSTRGFWQWGSVARVRTLMNQLGALPPGSVTPSVVAGINTIGGHTTGWPPGNASTVVVSTLLPFMLAQVDATADSRLPAVMGMFASWNLLQLDLNVDGAYDNPAVAIFNAWYETLVGQVFADELGTRYERNWAANLAGRLLIPGIVPLFHDYLDGQTVSGAVTGALIDALDSLTGTYGTSDMSTWLAPAAVTTWTPIGAIGVPDTPWMNRGTYNQITHLGRGAKMSAQNVIAPGQSGDPRSPHFADQLLNYATWSYKPMRLNKASLQGNTESTLVLSTN